VVCTPGFFAFSAENFWPGFRVGLGVGHHLGDLLGLHLLAEGFADLLRLRFGEQQPSSPLSEVLIALAIVSTSISSLDRLELLGQRHADHVAHLVLLGRQAGDGGRALGGGSRRRGVGVLALAGLVRGLAAGGEDRGGGKGEDERVARGNFMWRSGDRKKINCNGCSSELRHRKRAWRSDRSDRPAFPSAP
jgi:hypothetical protein